jgi:hypothetical protein
VKGRVLARPGQAGEKERAVAGIRPPLFASSPGG